MLLPLYPMVKGFMRVRGGFSDLLVLDTSIVEIVAG